MTRPLGGRAQTEQDVRERRLAGARGADDRDRLADGHDEVDVVERGLAVRIAEGDVLERQRRLEPGEGRRAKRPLRKVRRVEPRLHFVNAAREIGQMPVQSVQLIQQRQQPQQHEAIGEEIAAQHVARAHEEDVGAGDDHHRAGHGQRLGDRKEQRERFGAALFRIGLGLVQLVELLDLAFLGVRGAHDPHAGKRLAEERRHAVIEIGQLDADRLQAPVDERQRAAERDRQHDHERRQRPRQEEQAPRRRRRRCSCAG